MTPEQVAELVKALHAIAESLDAVATAIVVAAVFRAIFNK